MPALSRLLSEGGISARIELPGCEHWAGSCERRSVEQRRNGVSVERQDSGEEVALPWGEGGVKKRGWAELERFSTGRKAVEKKNNPSCVLLASWCPFPETKNQRTQHKASRVLLSIRPFFLLFFFFILWRVGNSPLSCLQLQKRENGLCFTNGQTVRPRSNVCFSPQKPCCTTWCYFHRQLK